MKPKDSQALTTVPYPKPADTGPSSDMFPS